MGSKTQKFLKERHTLQGHRLGYESSKHRNRSNLNSAPSKKNSQRAYIVEIDSTHGMQSILKFALKKNFIVNDDGGYSLKFKSDNFHIDATNMYKDETKFGENLTKKILPESISDQFDLISIDQQIELDLTTDSIIDKGRIFRYQRIYNNRVVRSNDDELTIAIDSKGLLRWARVSMRDLKLTPEYVETIENAKENETTLDSVINTSYTSLKHSETQKEVAVHSVTANSAAEAYCQIEEGSKIKLFPCISYVSDLVLEDGNSITTIIDAPHTHKSLKEFKNGKKHRMHFANGNMGNSMFVLGR